jgi:glutathione S-transferase
VAPKFGFPVDEQKIAASIPNATLCVTEIARLLGDQAFMAGDALSIADVMLAPHLDFLADAPEGAPMFAAHPALAMWLDQMKSRPSMVVTEWDSLAKAVIKSDMNG